MTSWRNDAERVEAGSKLWPDGGRVDGAEEERERERLRTSKAHVSLGRMKTNAFATA